MIKLSDGNFKIYALACVGLHAIIWIALPLLLDGSIRRDVAEGVVDGPLWQLTYLRHPPMSSWLSGIASQAGSYRYFVLYSFSAMLAGGAFLAVAWFLKSAVSAHVGLLALLVGLLSPFGTYIPLNLNHNITSLLFWGASLPAIWFAFQRNEMRLWVMLGLVVGLSLWAKYAIVQLYIPIALYIIWLPEWREKLFRKGPWIALAIACVTVSPQVYHHVTLSSSALAFLVKTEMSIFSMTQGRYIGEFFLNIITIQLGFLILPLIYAGPKLFRQAKLNISNFLRTERLGQYLIVASLGPILVIFIAALFGRRPSFLWLTTLGAPFAAFWAYTAWKSAIDHTRSISRVMIAAIVLEIFNSLTFTAMRYIAPATSKVMMNQDIDSRKLTELAVAYWDQVAGGRIPFMVSIGPATVRGFQRAAGIAFDLPYRVNILQDGDPATAPWLDLTVLEKEGALIVSQSPIPESFSVLGQSVVDHQKFDIPGLRNATSTPIYFARSVPLKPRN